MSARDYLKLTCTECGWMPEDGVTMGVVAAHFATEHPDVDEANVTLQLVLLCPQCRIVAPLTRDDGKRTIHDCPQCHRTYRVPYRDRS